MYKSAFGRSFFGAKRPGLTKEQKEARSKQTKKWWDEHPEAKIALSERQKELFWSDEKRQEQSERMKDVWANNPDRHQTTSECMTNTLNEYYKTHRNYWYGKKRTPEQIAKCVAACKITNERKRQEKIESGELVWCEKKNKYVKPKPERQPILGRIKCVETGAIFDNELVASKELGLNPTMVIKVIRGDYETTKKYHFEAIDK